MNLGEFVISFLNPDHEDMDGDQEISLENAMEIFKNTL